MRYDPVRDSFRAVRDRMFISFNHLSMSHPTGGYLLSLPVAVIDITLETAESAIRSIQFAVAGIIVLGGATLFPHTKFKIKNGMKLFEKSLTEAARFPIKLVLAPFKVFFQTIAIAKNPQNVSPFNYEAST